MHQDLLDLLHPVEPSHLVVTVMVEGIVATTIATITIAVLAVKDLRALPVLRAQLDLAKVV